MSRGAVIAALPGELKPWVRGWKREQSAGVTLWRQKRGEDELLAVCAGAGADAATRAFARVEQEGPLDWAASVGWAGALNPEALAGRAYAVAEVVDAGTGERFTTAAPRVDSGGGSLAAKSGLRLVSVAAIVSSPAEKQGLGSLHAADLADMEAATVARLAGAHGIPFHCIKGVSDGHADSLPDFQRFLAPDGRFRAGAFIASTLFKPRFWPTLIRLGKNSRRSAKALAIELKSFSK